MHVVFIASEGTPYAKTGGLADVVGELPRALKKANVDITTILPLYRNTLKKFEAKLTFVKDLPVSLYGSPREAKIFRHDVEGRVIYFVRFDHYFDRDALYGYDDDGERFGFFSKAALQLIQDLPHVDVIHVHDWHTGAVPVLLREHYRNHPAYSHIKTVVTIHNPAFQGAYDPNYILPMLELPYRLFDEGYLRLKDKVNLLKSAIVYADKMTAVSPTNSIELLGEEASYGLNTVIELHRNKLAGILNGIDYELYEPASDKMIVQNFDEDHIELKAKNKLALQKEFHLIEGEDIPLFAMVTRLSWQKGINIVIQSIERMIAMGTQVMIVGTGETWYEDQLKYLAHKYKGKVAIFIGYSDEVARKVYASADFYMMPSLFEPCGISQMIALRYGTVPIVRQVGGLKDTIQAYNEYTDEGNGFGFMQFDPEDFIRAVGYALHFYHQKPIFNGLIRRAMLSNNSWDESARQYADLYQSL